MGICAYLCACICVMAHIRREAVMVRVLFNINKYTVMKKLVLSLMAVCMTAVMFTSCDPDKPHCWEVTYKLNNADITIYQYCSKNDLNAYVDDLEERHGVKVTTKRAGNLSESDCIGKNLDII